MHVRKDIWFFFVYLLRCQMERKIEILKGNAKANTFSQFVNERSF